MLICFTLILSSDLLSRFTDRLFNFSSQIRLEPLASRALDEMERLDLLDMNAEVDENVENEIRT